MQVAKDCPSREIERVWYCPECDGLHTMIQGQGFMFKDEGGPFLLVYEKRGDFKTHKVYLIGDL